MTDREALDKVLNSINERRMRASVIEEQRLEKFNSINSVIGKSEYKDYVLSSELLTMVEKEILVNIVTEDNYEQFKFVFDEFKSKVSEGVSKLYEKYTNNQ